MAAVTYSLPGTILPSYQILQTLQDGNATVVYRGLRKQHRRTVVIKLRKADYPPIKLIMRLKQAHRLPQGLDHPGIVAALRLDNHQNHHQNHHQNPFALGLENCGGISLRHQILSGPLPIATFLPMAMHLADILAMMHQQGGIRKDIKPSKHMSPEQPRRMNRQVDYRSDYYSLGVTLYEMLTNKLPFQSADLLKIMYSHIANTPLSPTAMNSEVPEAIAHIVTKLIAKTAEDRYQMAQALRADLARCWQDWQQQGTIDSFAPGALGAASQLVLHGRESDHTYHSSH